MQLDKSRILVRDPLDHLGRDLVAIWGGVREPKRPRVRHNRRVDPLSDVVVPRPVGCLHQVVHEFTCRARLRVSEGDPANGLFARRMVIHDDRWDITNEISHTADPGDFPCVENDGEVR